MKSCFEQWLDDTRIGDTDGPSVYIIEGNAAIKAIVSNQLWEERIPLSQIMRQENKTWVQDDWVNQIDKSSSIT